MLDDNLPYDVAIAQARRPGKSAYGAGIDSAVEQIDSGNVGDISLVDLDGWRS